VGLGHDPAHTLGGRLEGGAGGAAGLGG